MAVRSGAGTGVVVSLVVFVLTTVFLLVLTIVFYAGKSREMEERVKAEQALDKYAGKQRNTDALKAMEAAAGGQPVALHLMGRIESTNQYLGAPSPQATLDAIKSEFEKLGVPKDNGIIRQTMVNLNTDLRTTRSEVASLKQTRDNLEGEIAQKNSDIAQMKEAHQKELDDFGTRIATYRDAGSDFKKKLEDAIAELDKAKDALENRYRAQVAQLTSEVDDQGREVIRLRQRLQEFEKSRNEIRIRAQDPSTLVDGQIIDAPGSTDEVFIDRGKKNHVVLGMTFEVYSEKSSIRVNPQTGDIPRGKASLQVVKVNDTTSVCKITRNVPGQPVLRNDVIANAVYDPDYKFKFLVHGKFDVDYDGKPSETEAEYLRSLVVEWGGVVVTGDDIPGDLDFLILGEVPPNPPQPSASATEVQFTDYIHRRQAHETYMSLFNQARGAQIPVMNANRFFILIGHTDR